MSGIATLTQKMVSEIKSVGSETKLLDTRKTVPGLRMLDKWAVLIGICITIFLFSKTSVFNIFTLLLYIGGGVNHRMGLFDMMMIKDNHIAAAGSIHLAVVKAQQYLEANKLSLVKVEVETDTLEQVQEVKEVIKAQGESNRVSRVMLDNMIIKKDNQLDFTTLNKAMEIMKGTI